MQNLASYYYDLLTKSSRKGALTTEKRKLRFIFRTICYYPYSINLIRFVQHHKYLSEKVFTYMSLLNKIYRPYLCNMFGLSKKLSSVKENYQFIDKYFPEKIIPEFYEKGSIQLAEITGTDEERFKIILSLYPNFDKEGDIDLKMVNSENIPLATITFSFIKNEGKDTLLLEVFKGHTGHSTKTALKKQQKAWEECSQKEF